MSNYSGYMDKVVMLDLSTQEVKDYPWSDEDRELYIGGRAMASKIMSDCLKGGESALSEENLIVITTGPLTGTGAPCSNHFNVSALSPATGAVTYASCGGEFGYYLKKAGYDALIIRGKCKEPMWLEIQGGKFEFNKAKTVWGLKTAEAQEEMQYVMDEKRGCRVKCGMLAIGPAGENLVKYASVFSGEREAEHCDIGGVFGFKNLKGIVAAGNSEIAVADMEKAREVNKEWTAILRSHPVTGELLPKQGTAGFAEYLNEKGLLPTANYKKGQFEDIAKISGETFADKCNVVNRGCTYCPIRCERSVMLGDKLVRGPELDVMALMGSNILNSDVQLINKWNYEMYEYGLDAVSTANTIAWAMEAREAGVFKSELCYGITTNISEMLEHITYREEAGDELAEGSVLLDEKYGGGCAYVTKPLELIAVDSCMGVEVNGKGASTKKALTDFADNLQEAAASSGQCRLVSVADIPGAVFSNPDGIAAAAIKAVLPLSTPVFKALALLPEELTDKLPHFVHTKELRYALGMDMSLAKYVEAGKNGLAAERELNEKLGVKAKKTYVPATLGESYRNAKKSPVEKIKAMFVKPESADEAEEAPKANAPVWKRLLKKA